MIIENCVFDVGSSVPALLTKHADSETAWNAMGNEGDAGRLNSSERKVFEIPHDYQDDLIKAGEVKNVVTATGGGAGNRWRRRQHLQTRALSPILRK